MIKSFILAALLAASLSFAQVSSIPSASGSGASTFDNIGSGTNTSATLTCGSGCTLVTTAGIFRLPNGTSAPGTCTVGDAFFDTDATAGLNFYGCTATNTWTLLGDGGSGSTSFTDIADLKVTKTSDTVLTVAAGNYRYLASDGTYSVASLSSATLTVASGAETEGTAVRFSIDENSGSPIIRCIVATALTSGNYTASGCTKTSADVFPAGNLQLASVGISGGVWGTPVDRRALDGVSNYTAGAGLTKTGPVFSLGTFTLKTKIALPLVACSGTTGTLMWDTLASNAPTATCSAGSTETAMMRGVADWPDSDGDYSVQVAFLMPDDWDTSSNLDAIILWRTTATSGDAVFQVQTACRADAEVDDVAWNTASTVTDTAKGTANQLNSAAITNITKTGCAAGELLHVRLLRNRTHASDTLAAALSVGHVELTARRSIVP